MAAEASRSGPSPGSYIGSLISLTSKSGIRYEGIIYRINPEECTICLGNVHCFGTEGRKIDGPQIPPSEKIYDYVVFRGTNIKDLWVISLPPVETASIHNDPAIIQLHHSPMGAASTPGSATISDQSSQAVRLGHARSTIEGGLPLYQAGKNIEYIGSIPVANSSGFGVPRYSQGFYTPTSGLSHLPQTPSLSAPLELATLLSLPQHAQFSTINSSFPSGTLSLQEAIASLPPIVSSASTLASTSVQHSSIHSLFATTPSSLFSIPSPTTVAPTPASVFGAKPPFNLRPNRSLVNSHPASSSGLNIPLAPPLGYINTPGAPEPGNNTYICRGPSNESGPFLPFQTISQYMPSNINSFSSIKAETSLPIVTPGQLQDPTPASVFGAKPPFNLRPNRSFVNSHPASGYGLNIRLAPPLGYINTPGAPEPSQLQDPTPASVFGAKPPFNLRPNRSLVNSHPASGSGLNIPLAPPLGYINTLGAPEPGQLQHPTPASVFGAKPPFNLRPNRSLVNSHPASGSGLNIPLAPPLGYINTPGAPEPGNNTYICRGPSNESGPSLPFQTISQYMPSNINSFSSIKAETSLPIVTPGQLQHPSYSMLPSSLPVQTIQEDARFKEHEPKIKSEYEALTYEPTQPATSMKESLPKLSRSWFSGPVKLSEDFDFNAMNEKFNKAEVWGHLGHGKTLAEYDGQSSKVNAIQEEDDESLNPEIQPVYSRDDFFDNLSSKPFEPGTHSGTARFSEPLKVDMETSGDSRRHRSNRGGGRGFRDGNGGRWRSDHDRGDGSS